MEPMSPLAMSANEHGHHHHHHEPSLTGSRSGQILWIRGLTRLQTQVGTPAALVYSQKFPPINS